MTNLAANVGHHETLQRLHDAMLLHLRSTQLNLSAGYKSKAQRLRDATKKSFGDPLQRCSSWLQSSSTNLIRAPSWPKLTAVALAVLA
jgi:hypothetical protein